MSPEGWVGLVSLALCILTLLTADGGHELMTAAATGPSAGPYLPTRSSSAPLSTWSREERDDLCPFGSELWSLPPLQMSEYYFISISSCT